LHDLQQLLRGTRLLTLTGVGGTGKTRLALELARASSASFEHVHWFELAGLATANALPAHIASALGVREIAGGSAVDSLIQHLSERTVLLVLDNCEHLIDACAQLADALLRSCPSLTILATSREALGVGGERAWLVPPLSLPASSAGTVEAVQEAEAIKLFLDRSRSVAPSFALSSENVQSVVRICRRLDGIPLAIELAAARVKMLTPQEIATRLEDNFRLLASGNRTTVPRHRTLRAAIDWSCALLSETEQLLLQRLSVFAGGFRLESAEAVCAGGALYQDDMLDTLGALVDKSLVLVRTGAAGSRFGLLETVRQYAHDRLQEAGELDAYRRRHAEHFLQLAEQASPFLVGGAGDPVWMPRMREESDNLRALAVWSEETNEPAFALRLGAAVQWVLFATGWFKEGRALLTRALERADSVDPYTKALGATALAAIYLWQGDTALIQPLLESQLPVLRASNDRCTHAYAVSIIGAAISQGGDPYAAQPILEEAVQTARQSPSPVLHAIALYWRGLAARARGEFELAQSSFEQGIGIGRSMNNPPSIGHPLTQLGRLLLSRGALGDSAVALTMLLEALELHRANDDRWGIAWALEGLAIVSTQHGSAERAARLQAGAESLRATMAAPRPPAERAEAEATIDSARVTLGARFDGIWKQAYNATLDEVLDYALAGSDITKTQEPAPLGVQAQPQEVAADLQVHALGPLQVICSAHEIDVRKWPSAKARELLVYLLCNPEGVSREQVGAALWPDATTAQLRNSFHVTVHRLRKGVGDGSWIEALGERYRIASGVRVTFDVTTFETETVAALRELRRGIDASERLRTALALYRGDFLQGEKVGDWHLEIHDRLQRLYRDGLRALGNQEAALEHFEEAAGWYERLIAIDELDEDAYRRIMLCRMRMGDRADAARLYQKLSHKLESELGAEPSRETRAIFQQLQAVSRS
jgi:predicted ATPase/DNA-binding SARP family transcriptional activator